MCPLLFILRGITLHGAISVDATCELRELAWAMLADDSDLEALDALTTTIGPDDTLEAANATVERRASGHHRRTDLVGGGRSAQ